METRILGTQGLEVSTLGLGCMGMSEFYGRADEGEAIATITARSSSESPSSTRPTCTAGVRTSGSSARRSRAGARTSCWRRSSATSAAERRVPRHRRQPRVRARRLRGVAASGSASRRSTSTTSTASTRRRRSRRRSARWPSSSGRGRSATSASPRRRRRRSAARTPSTRSRRCRASTRSGRATRRPRSCRRCASSGSASWPTARSAAASSGRIRSTDDLDERLPETRAALPGGELRAEPRAGRGCRGAGRGEGVDTVAGRPRLGADAGDDIVPIPGTNGSGISRRTRRRASSSRRTSSRNSSARLRSVPPRATAIRTCPPSTGGGTVSNLHPPISLWGVSVMFGEEVGSATARGGGAKAGRTADAHYTNIPQEGGV